MNFSFEREWMAALKRPREVDLVFDRSWMEHRMRGVPIAMVVVTTDHGLVTFKNVDCRKTTPEKLLIFAREFMEKALWNSQVASAASK